MGEMTLRGEEFVSVSHAVEYCVTRAFFNVSYAVEYALTKLIESEKKREG